MARTRRASKLATPPLPLEIIADIIDRAVELLIEDEFDLETHAPLSNRFLLSAALVNRTWHPIAVKALIRTGIVTSKSTVGFIAKASFYRMDDTLKSLRFGEATGPAAQVPGLQDAALDVLLQLFPALDSIELVEAGSRWKTSLAPANANRRIERLHLINPDIMGGGFLRKFGQSPPKHLVITETRKTPDPPHETQAVHVALSFTSFLRSTSTFNVVTNQPMGVIYYSSLVILGKEDMVPRLRSCHFECTSILPYQYIAIVLDHAEETQGSTICDFPILEHLASHLRLVHPLAARGKHPRLTSIEILPDPPGNIVSGSVFDAPGEPLLLELIANLPVLAKLKVPSCWANDAVRESCEAKGVELLQAEVGD
ncbi:hypothetical protein RQP46_007077 [Phenoliferia psychrophenolica]